MMTSPVLVSGENNTISLHPKRQRISRKNKQLIQEYLDEKYGHKCCYCSVTANLTFHHKDGNRNNTTLNNMAWACPDCQNTHPVVNSHISLSPNENQFETPLAKNQQSEPRFVAWSKEWVIRHPSTPLKVFCQEAAIPSKCHPKTVEGYVVKYSGSNGHLSVTMNNIKEQFVEASSRLLPE